MWQPYGAARGTRSWADRRCVARAGGRRSRRGSTAAHPTWTFTQLSLDAWIEDSAVFQLGLRLYQTVRSEDRLVVMLDGLDEIFSTRATEVPRTPNDALNEVRRSRHFTVVACRQAAVAEILESADGATWPAALLTPIDSSDARDQLSEIVDPGTAASIVEAVEAAGQLAASPLRQPLYFGLFPEEIRDPDRRAAAIGAALTNHGLVDLLWQRFLDTAVTGCAATGNIDVLVLVGLLALGRRSRLREQFARKAADGVQVRLCLGDPDGSSAELRARRRTYPVCRDRLRHQWGRH